MNTTSRILSAIAAINSLRPASQHLRAEVHGMSDTAGLQEFYIVEDVSGQVAALGYSEADLLANLQKLANEEILERLRNQWGPAKGLSCRADASSCRNADGTPKGDDRSAERGPLGGWSHKLEAEGVRQ